LILKGFLVHKVLDLLEEIDYIITMNHGGKNMKVKGNGPKKRNPYAKALTKKCFTSRMVSAKVRYVRNPKHKGKEFGHD